MNPTQITAYRCDMCDELHSSRLDAEDCCPPDVTRVAAWSCGSCGCTYDDQDHARECCWDGETELEPYIPTPAELEAAGQQRLAI